MNKQSQNVKNIHDPLGLRGLPPLEPPEDGWAAIQAALTEDRRQSSRRRRGMALLAMAACVVLAVVLVPIALSPTPPANTGPAATIDTVSASDEQEQTLRQLITMSQNLEQQLRGLREGSGSIPASSAVYVAELEDLVAQVDNRISVSPDSINLWGQRVNLLLDLAQIYQHQWEREYGRMASL
jgi:hypothetical protein